MGISFNSLSKENNRTCNVDKNKQEDKCSIDSDEKFFITLVRLAFGHTTIPLQEWKL